MLRNRGWRGGVYQAGVTRRGRRDERMARGTGRVLGVLGALLAMGGLSAARAEPAPTALRVAQPNAAHFPEITLYALPSARDGHVVGGLEGAFSVAENGSPARILRVESQAGTLDLCLALDRSQSMLQEQKILYARLAAQTFLHQLQPSDRAALVSFADGASLDHPLSGNRTSLSAAIARAEAMGETTCLFDGIYWAIG
ncbi:MAG: VWA domain-containing protein, partial [Armatimonadetes bacterium]|nr:VWA domain-containing protein [Armatimonadota bacterium]